MNPSAHVLSYSQSHWRRQMNARHNSMMMDARKRLVAVTIIDQSRSSSSLIDIRNLLVLVLYEDGRVSTQPQRNALRFTVYRVRQIAHGVLWGGAENCQLFKDLRLTPCAGARGQRMGRCRSELRSKALKLDSRLSRMSRYPAAPCPGLKLPRIWAGFRRSDAVMLRGAGPEFEQACRNNAASPIALFDSGCKSAYGLTLFPLEWVSGQLDHAVGVFAEVTPSLRHQVFRYDATPKGLSGFQGASAYDFYGSRYRLVSQSSSDRAAERGFRDKSAFNPAPYAEQVVRCSTGNGLAPPLSVLNQLA